MRVPIKKIKYHKEDDKNVRIEEKETAKNERLGTE